MKFTDGFWHARRGVAVHYAREVDRVVAQDGELRAISPTKVVRQRGDVLNLPVLTTSVSAPMENVVRVRHTHHKGVGEPFRFEVAAPGAGEATVAGGEGTVTSGALSAHLSVGKSWSLDFRAAGRTLTRSGGKSAAWVDVSPGAAVDHGADRLERDGRTSYMFDQLDLGVGELVYGLGERFGPVIKNGQSVDIWNEDGGTSSEQAYKNVPFYLTNAGYGVFVNDPGHVSYEVGSEAVERVQFSVPGETLDYYVIYGPDPKSILERYTALTGRPARVPAWSYGLWLSTSFTTDYDEQTVSSFIDGMAEREIPLSLFHFDCFWMREFNWCDFEWDERVFPDPEGMLARLHDRGLRVCVWINPYIAQQSPLFDEGMAAGYLVKNRDGSVWQWDRWQAGMGLVDFTNPDATAWYQDKLRRLVRQGVDAFKTDFGERIPVDVQYFDGSDPERMHNYYTHLYNQAVHEVLAEERGAGDAVLFARSATAGGQQFPVHWGGDNTASYVSMAESLRGGLSLAYSGFGYWSHDIGGFELTPDAGVFKRWTAFGLLSSHSRMHGSGSYRVPWMFDEDESDPTSAVAVTRTFARFKNRLAPYLVAAGEEAHRTGTPTMRPMLLEFPDDLTAAHLDRQYMLGQDLLVAPVFSAEGDVDLYLPAGEWVGLLTGERVTGGRWLREHHDYDSVPLYVRPGAVVPLSRHEDKPDADHLDGLTLLVHAGPDADWSRTVEVLNLEGEPVSFTVRRAGGTLVAESDQASGWSLQVVAGETVAAAQGRAEVPA
ncbi:alpha-xylosidase [Isoptericola sp. S6320L]|uniref:alpha-xylosidase n=1 Tax=Isoptericola sp. S6320L TaxID=2926411 RepID=UPI001FF2AA0A|nr:alpha-xylosidase [Isoptericola sp. S6320L]MCK0115728.1 alpha-xylosidase [Isoptericola sp. S6320L]